MIKIVQFQTEHIDGICEIETLSFSVPWSRRIFEEIPDVPWLKFFTAIENGEVIGYCGLNHIFDEGQIVNIAVHPDHRRRGIGDMLMDRMIAYAENNDIILLTLEVRQANTAARTLYEKYGFYEVGLRPRYYTHPTEDAVLMNKEVTRS
jgi:ribosomal-protein-alanine acetyltransferase